MDPSLKISLSYQNNADEPMPYFLIEVTYTSEEGVKSKDSIKLKKLPIKLNYLVYFIRRHLRVHFNNEHTQIKYVSLAAYSNLQDFEVEM